MTVRVERTFEFDAPREDVWSFIADPEKRSRPISVVERFEVTGENTARWHVRLPLPVVNRTIAVDTEDVTVDPPRFVRFVGRSKVFRVVGEHELVELDGGRTSLENEFVVDGRVPGVERFFSRNLDEELENLKDAIAAELGLEA
jgi:carbon monoxide dehydrogenase subunit G